MSTAAADKVRTILHVDMDAFYASVEQRDRPELKGKPVVVGAGPHERGVVAAASYEARRFGIHSAMPSREAGRRCPHAVFLPPDMERYAAASRQVFAILDRFTPLIEPLSIDEAFMDVTGTLRIFGDGVAIARQIRAAIQKEVRLTASVGVAPNKFLAKIASDMNKPDGLTVVPVEREAIRRFLAPLAVGRLWGVGKVTQAALEKAGLRTIGDIQATPPGTLERLIGRDSAEHFKALAAGEDSRPVETEFEEKSISREYTFSEDCTDGAVVRRTLLELIADVGSQVREAGKYARVAQIKIRWKGFETITRQKTLPEPACDDVTLRAAAMELFEKVELTRPVRLVGFGVSGLSGPPARQRTLFAEFDRDILKRERLSATVDRIRKTYGADAIGDGSRVRSSSSAHR